jgi:hypothetical protein
VKASLTVTFEIPAMLNSVANLVLTRVTSSPMAATSPAPSESGMNAELGRTAAATFEDHQIAVVERARAHSHQDLFRPGPGILARSQHDPVNAAEAVDAIARHLFLLPIVHGVGFIPCLSAVQGTQRV